MMPDCKVCGSWFAAVNKREALCPICERALERLAGYAAPVVRCKDCKWFADNNGGEWYGCQMFQVVRITPEDAPKLDDFCSYGEQKDGGASNA